MATAFELAVEIGHYVGKLWGIATNPDIAEGNVPKDYEKFLVVKYGEPENGQTMLSGNVPTLLVDKFNQLVAKDSAEINDLTAGSLQRSLSTLQRIAALVDPVPGKTTNFSNLQGPLKEQLPSIVKLAQKLELVKS